MNNPMQICFKKKVMTKVSQIEIKELLQDMNINLINGVYDAKDGFEIVSHLIEEKVRLLNVKKFSTLIRTGEHDDSISDRMAELNAARESAKEFFAEKNEGIGQYRITAQITIEQF